jgi:hypothetical protein
MTQQISASENQHSKENIKTAMEDIALIKRIVNHAEINLRRLGWLFLVYGSATLAFLLFRIVLTFYTAHTSRLESVGTLSLILTVLSYIVSIVLFVLFIRKRREIGKSENVYTMRLFDMWGVMLFAPVVLELVTRLIGLAVQSSNAAIGNTVLSCMKYGAVCICIFFTGHYISSRTLKMIAAVLSVLFPILFIIPLPYVTAVNLDEITTAIQLYSYLAVKANIISLLLPFVYIGMGIFSMKKQRGSVYGDE